MGTLSRYLGVHEYDGQALTRQKSLPENGSEPCLTEAKGKTHMMSGYDPSQKGGGVMQLKQLASCTLCDFPHFQRQPVVSVTEKGGKSQR